MKRIMLLSRLLRLQCINNLLLMEAQRDLHRSNDKRKWGQFQNDFEHRERIHRELQKIILELETKMWLSERLAAHSLLPLLKAEKFVYKKFIFPEDFALERKNISLYYNLLYKHKLPLSLTKKLLEQKKILEYQLPE